MNTPNPVTGLAVATPSSAATPPAAGAPVAGPLDLLAVGLMGVLSLVWALQQISLKAAATHISPMLMVALRSGLALLLLGLLMRHRREVPGGANWKPGLAVGLLFGLEYLLVAEALRLTTASHVVVFLYTAPVFAAVGLHLWSPAERLGARQAAGIGMAFAGLALAFLGKESAGPAVAAGGNGFPWGDLLALLAGVAWGATTVTIRCSSLARAPAAETLAYQLLGAFVLLLPVAGWSGQWQIQAGWTAWLHLGFQSIVVSFASFLAWFWLLRRYLASRLGVFSFLTPLFGLVLGVLLLGEPIEPHFLLGSGLVLAGIGLVSGRGKAA